MEGMDAARTRLEHKMVSISIDSESKCDQVELALKESHEVPTRRTSSIGLVWRYYDRAFRIATMVRFFPRLF